MEQRKELLRFNELEFNYQLDRAQKFAECLNMIYTKLLEHYPEDIIKNHIKDIQACITDRSIKEDQLKDVLIKILLELNPAVKDMKCSIEVKKNLINADSLIIEPYLTEARLLIYNEMFQQKQIFQSTKLVTFYYKAGKFIVSQDNIETLKNKYSTFVEGEDLKIWDAVQNVKQAVLELEKVGRVDWSQIDLKGCGFASKAMNEYNFIPYQK